MRGRTGDGERSPEEQRRWEQYLYELHPRAELVEWAPSLRFFRYCRAVGGHANDGDELVVALRFTTEDDLLALCARLGIGLVRAAPDAPQPERGVPYTAEAFARFPSLVTHLPHLQQPGHVEVAGVPCFVWVHDGHLRIAVTDPEASPDLVTTRSVDGARRLEPLVEPEWWRVVEPPVDRDHCICPKHHLDLWVEHFA